MENSIVLHAAKKNLVKKKINTGHESLDFAPHEEKAI